MAPDLTVLLDEAHRTRYFVIRNHRCPIKISHDEYLIHLENIGESPLRISNKFHAELIGTDVNGKLKILRRKSTRKTLRRLLVERDEFEVARGL